MLKCYVERMQPERLGGFCDDPDIESTEPLRALKRELKGYLSLEIVGIS